MSIHQDILNEAYDNWNNDKLNIVSYSDLIDFLDIPIKKFSVLIGKYNYQVENGGHVQYYDNGYASRSDGDIDLHDELIILTKSTIGVWAKKQPQETQSIVEEVISVLDLFYVDIDDDRYCGEYEDDLNETYGEILNTSELDDLDTRYYNVNEKFLEIVEQYLQETLN